MPRRDFSKVPFAATGDVNTIPDAVQPDGSISLPQGWGFDYQRDNGAGGGTPDPLAKNIDREDMNGILNEITASIGEIQQNGFPIWVATAAPYPINAWVRHTDKIWRSRVINNSATPVEGADWTEVTRVTPSLVVLSGSGNYTVPANVYFLKYRVWGGGGGGGGVGSAGNGGAGAGGSGGYSEGVASVTPGQVIAYVNGAAGSGGGAGGAGTAGGTSTFGTIAQATGGTGGAPNTPSGGSGGAGGAGSLGQRNLFGAGGSSGSPASGSGGMGATAPGGGGAGGGGAIGTAGAGSTPGAGGGGSGGAGANNGGAGGAGQIILELPNV